jgi:type II secretory pathway pseudopilin PulG
MRSSSSTRAEEGFTLLETMVALLCFTVLIFALWALIGQSTGSFFRSTAAARAAAQASLADRGIRRAAARIEAPFWIRPEGLVSDEGVGGLSVSYLDGQSSKRLKISFSKGEILIDADGSILRSAAQPPFAAKTIESETGTPLGIEVSFTLGGKPFITRAAFASAPVGGAGEKP